MWWIIAIWTGPRAGNGGHPDRDSCWLLADGQKLAGCTFASHTYACQMYHVKAHQMLYICNRHCFSSHSDTTTKHAHTRTRRKEMGSAVRTDKKNCVSAIAIIHGHPLQMPDMPVKASNPAWDCTPAATIVQPRSPIQRARSTLRRARSPLPIRREVKVVAIQSPPKPSLDIE